MFPSWFLQFLLLYFGIFLLMWLNTIIRKVRQIRFQVLWGMMKRAGSQVGIDGVWLLLVQPWVYLFSPGCSCVFLIIFSAFCDPPIVRSEAPPGRDFASSYLRPDLLRLIQFATQQKGNFRRMSQRLLSWESRNKFPLDNASLKELSV